MKWPTLNPLCICAWQDTKSTQQISFLFDRSDSGAFNGAKETRETLLRAAYTRMATVVRALQPVRFLQLFLDS